MVKKYYLVHFITLSRMKQIFASTILLLSVLALWPATRANAQTTSLNGSWEFRFDQGRTLEETRDTDFIATDVMIVPGCWDVMPQYLKQRGTAHYRREITLVEDVLNAWWRIDGMGLRSEYYVDGRKIGSSSLPYSSFEVETGPLSQGRHILTAVVDNNLDSQKMKMFLPNYDFYAFGGFYHGMSLTIQTTRTMLHRINVRTLDYKTGDIELELLFHGQPAPSRYTATVSIDGARDQKVTVDGDRVRVTVPDPKPWDIDTPALHQVKVAALGTTAEASFGLRKIEARAGRLYLNDREIYLKGVNRHESHPSFGSATPEALMMLDLQNLKSLGGNFIRGCHYPQSQRFLDLCDRMGVLVWEESLGWGNTVAQVSDPEFIALQREQMALTVRESFNHPSVIIFGFLNEFVSGSEEGKALSDQLVDIIRSMDSGRLVTFACNRQLSDIALESCDMVSLNIYPGWIGTEPGTPEQLKERIGSLVNKLVTGFRERYPDKPVIFSEMGTCGIYGYRDPSAAQWTEEFQAEYVGDVLDAVMGHPETSGICIWQFNDAPSYHRDGSTVRTKPFAINLAGLYDQYRRPKLVVDIVRVKLLDKSVIHGRN